MNNKTMAHVETGKAFGFGWEAVQKHFWYFVGLAVLFVFVTYAPNVLIRSNNFFSTVVGWVVNAWLMAGLLHIGLSYLDGTVRPLGDLFAKGAFIPRLLASQLLYGIIVTIGLVLLIVPGIYLALRYQFLGFFIVDKNMGVGEAFTASAKLTAGIKWQLLWFGFASAGVALVGLLALGVGIFVALPVVWLANVFLFRSLVRQSETPVAAPAA